MKIRKGALVSIILVFSLALTGCSKEEKSEKTPEQKFIEIFEKKINDRWTKIDKLSSKNLDQDSYNNQLIEVVEDEVEDLKLAAESLNDVTFKGIANNYIEGTLAQIEAFKTNDSDLMWSYQEKSDKLRKPSLTTLVDTYGVKINEEHQQTYKDFKESAMIINKENDAKKYAEKLALEMQFNKIEEDYGSITYETIIENTSNITFDSLSFNVKCKDKDGVVILNDYIYLNNFEPNTKQKAEIFTSKEGIETLSVTLDSFYLK